MVYFVHDVISIFHSLDHCVASVFWHCWLGNRNFIWPVWSWVLVACWWWRFDWSFACLQFSPPPPSPLAPQTIQSGEILALANPGPPGKLSLKQREIHCIIGILVLAYAGSPGIPAVKQGCVYLEMHCKHFEYFNQWWLTLSLLLLFY